MTHTTARSVANAVVVSAGVAAAVVVMTTPPLRRLAFRGIGWWLGASVPVYLVTQVRRAWRESAPDADIMSP